MHLQTIILCVSIGFGNATVEREYMIMWKLNSLVGRCKDRGIGGVTYREIGEATGLSSNTLARILQGTTTRIDKDTIHRLLSYFSDLLGEELKISDLLEWKRDQVTNN